jgi:hypothetical protein
VGGIRFEKKKRYPAQPYMRPTLDATEVNATRKPSKYSLGRALALYGTLGLTLPFAIVNRKQTEIN